MKKLFIRNHPLIDTLVRAKGNPKVLILMEPLWGIPNNLIAPLATLYMVAMGVTDVQIGLLLSIGFAFQMAFSIGGGILTDKIGRKATTMLGDFFGWVVACTIWAVSQNFWFFLAAALFNCFEQVNQTAWICLLVEDADQDDLVNIFTWISIGGLVTVFVAPLSGLLIGQFSLVPVVRAFYAMWAVFMLIKGYVTLRYVSETKQGVQRKKETKGVPVSTMLKEYFQLAVKLYKDKTSLGLLLMSLILSVSMMVTGSFSSLYMNKNLGIPETYLTYFPILKALVMLVFMFAVQHFLERFRIKVPMLAGILFLIGCQLLLIFCPPAHIPTLVVYILLDSIAWAMVYPRRETLMTLHIDPKERARSMSIIGASTLVLTAPFGYLAGWLSSVDRRLPFVFIAALYGILLFVILFFKDRKDDAEEEPALATSKE